MISLIIIGRNEGWKLTKCFQSVFNTIKYNNLSKYEVIYVDSKSTDDSIERAKKFEDIKIFQITGDCNAAIARNIGEEESSGDTLFFIDGDMEIIPEFLPSVYSEEGGLKYNFVSGDFENNYYNEEGKYLYKDKQFDLPNDVLRVTTGGLFLIKRNIWISVNGMKTKYRKSQDLDLGLRLAKKGIKLLRKKEILARHYTVSYRDSSRMWTSMLNGSEFYRSVLLRDHITSWRFYKNFLRENYTSIALLIIIIIAVIINEPLLSFIYLSFILIRTIINMQTEIFRIPSRFLYFILRDALTWGAFIAFWPKEIKSINYIRMNG